MRPEPPANPPHAAAARASSKRRFAMLRPVVEAAQVPTVRFVLIVFSIVLGTLAATKTGLVPRKLYMSEKDMERLEANDHEQNESTTMTIVPTPRKPRLPQPKTTDADVAKISQKGMEAVKYLLRYTKLRGSEQVKFAETNTATTVDWDVRVKYTPTVIDGIVTMICEPPFWSHWSDEDCWIHVWAEPSSENVVLSLNENDVINVHGELEFADENVLVTKASVKRIAR